MYMLQLFDVAEPLTPIEARTFDLGVLRIGRDAAADWPIADPDHALSRAHCELTAGSEGLTVRSLGSNGVYDDKTGDRLPDQVGVPVDLPCTLRMGRYRLAATEADRGTPTVFVPAPAPAFADGTLLEAFCEGAGIDASALSADEPAAIMRRAGALYAETVQGVSAMMKAREAARAVHQQNRTMISGAGNNPFKWAPPQRLAADLLLGGGAGFLSGQAALAASFDDLARHHAATVAGYRAALVHVVAQFAPDAIDAAIADRVTMLKGRAGLALAHVGERHAALARDVVERSEDSAAGQAFGAAYDAADSGRMGA